jgi:hypothetical protein
MMTSVSPRVLNMKWGSIEVEELGVFKDVKLFPGGGRAWDWMETGTRHIPGIQPADVAELLDRGSEVIVLSQGMLLALQTSPETEEFLKKRGTPFYIEQTEAAVDRYNSLVEQGKRVGGLFHSTC